MKIDIKEIAREAGVSTATVSRALNGKGPIREVTRNKILRIARQHNYLPNSNARGLSRRKTETIGVILPELVDEFFMDLIHSIDEAAYRSNYYVMISSSHSHRNTIETLMAFMGSGRVDGVILMAPQLQDSELFSFIEKINRPLVLLNALKNPEYLDRYISFRIDNYRGAAANVEHLVEHGYKKIGMIKGPEGNCDAEERFSGFKNTLEKHNIDFNPAFVVNGDFTSKSGYYGFMRLMSQSDKPEAVFAANDMMALGAYEAAKDSNIVIPDHVALTGFDDVFLTRLLTPRLTTVHAPITELGNKAVSYLLKMISGEVEVDQPYHESLSTGLVIGGSCGCHKNSPQIIT